MPIDSSAHVAQPNVLRRLDRQHRDARRQERRRGTRRSCSSKRSQLGRLTTRAATPASASCSAAATHTATSLPVPRSTTAGSCGVDARCPRPRSTAEPSVVTVDVLAAEDQRRRSVVADDVGPRVDRLVRVGRPDHVQAGDRPERGELLDRLVGRAVLADADRVVGEHEADLGLGQRRPAGWTASCSRRRRRTCRRSGRIPPCLAMPTIDGAHGVLADAVVDVAAAGIGTSTATSSGRARCRCCR